MYCKKCGAAVVGKFCSVCGERVRTNEQEYRLAMSRAKKSFVREKTNQNPGCNLICDRVADICWFTCERKYGVWQSGSIENVALVSEQLFRVVWYLIGPFATV